MANLKDVNEFVLRILEDEKNCEEYCRNVDDGGNYLQMNYCGTISEDSLINLIEKSKTKLCYQCFLSDLVICLKEEEVTPEVFDKLMLFRGKYRKSILIGLAHCDLSVYQLLELTKLKIDIEPLLKLILRFLKSDAFSAYDLEILLNKYSSYYADFSSSLSWMIEHYCDKTAVSQKKIIVLNRYLERP